MVTNEQVKDAVKQVLRTYPIDSSATQIADLIRRKIMGLGTDYDPDLQVFIPGGGGSRTRVAMVSLLGPAGEHLTLSASEEYSW